jgi:hypothetical protein
MASGLIETESRFHWDMQMDVAQLFLFLYVLACLDEDHTVATHNNNEVVFLCRWMSAECDLETWSNCAC